MLLGKSSASHEPIREGIDEVIDEGSLNEARPAQKCPLTTTA